MDEDVDCVEQSPRTVPFASYLLSKPSRSLRSLGGRSERGNPRMLTNVKVICLLNGYTMFQFSGIVARKEKY